MQPAEIARRRLTSQQAARPDLSAPGELVGWLGAVQAQDFLGSLWALGLRLPGASEALVEQAIAERQIVRTWPMRGTIHFVAPADARWMLGLLTPRVLQGSQGRLRQLGLDAPTIAKAGEVLARALAGGQQLTRPALYAELAAAGIAAEGSRGLHILGQLAHQQLICFGPRAGKQPTFVLMDEWLPPTPALPRDQALAALALRYFTSHGPATLQDFTWWAGLTLTDARAGLAGASGDLAEAEADGQRYFFAHEPRAEPAEPDTAFLLPPFDEFLVAYRDRSAALDPRFTNAVTPGSNGIFHPIVVLDGRVLGTWRRTIKRDSVQLTFSPFESFSAAQLRAMAATAERYAQFLGLRLLLAP